MIKEPPTRSTTTEAPPGAAMIAEPDGEAIGLFARGLRRLAAGVAYETARLRTALRKARREQARLLRALVVANEARRRQQARLERYRQLNRRLRDDLSKSLEEATSLAARLRDGERASGLSLARSEKRVADVKTRLKALEPAVADHRVLRRAYRTALQERATLARRLAESQRESTNRQEQSRRVQDRMRADLDAVRQASSVHEQQMRADLDVARQVISDQARNLADVVALKRALDDRTARLETELKDERAAIVAVARERGQADLQVAALEEALEARDQQLFEFMALEKLQREEAQRLAADLTAKVQETDRLTDAIRSIEATNGQLREERIRQQAELARADAQRAESQRTLQHLQTGLREKENAFNGAIDRMNALLSTTDPDELIALILETACTIVGGTAALLAIQDSKTLVLEVAGSVRLAEALWGNRRVWGAPVALAVTRTGEPWVIPLRDIVGTSLDPAAENLRDQTLISVPFRTTTWTLPRSEETLIDSSTHAPLDELVGALQIYRQGEDELGSTRLAQLGTFAGHAALALKAIRQRERVVQGLRLDLRMASRLNAHLLGRERYIEHLQAKVHSLEDALGEEGQGVLAR